MKTLVAALKKVVAAPYFTRIPAKKPPVQPFYLFQHKENPSEEEILAEVRKHQVLKEHQEKSFGLTTDLEWTTVGSKKFVKLREV